jgi:hypothetical protein
MKWRLRIVIESWSASSILPNPLLIERETEDHFMGLSSELISETSNFKELAVNQTLFPFASEPSSM